MSFLIRLQLLTLAVLHVGRPRVRAVRRRTQRGSFSIEVAAIASGLLLLALAVAAAIKISVDNHIGGIN